MMKVIWKFEVPSQLSFTLDLPEGACVLSVQMQHGKPQMWVLVDVEERPKETHAFRVQPTGVEFAMPVLGVHHFVGTFQPEPGLVFHLFRTGPDHRL